LRHGLCCDEQYQQYQRFHLSGRPRGNKIPSECNYFPTTATPTP
jgi:hypothetical protein